MDNKSLRKFISCRGCPGKILTDNGTIFTSQETQKFSANKNIEWQFSLSNAPWCGGFWERLVSIVKRCLKKVVGKACLNFYKLQIILSGIEIIINSRPLNMLYNGEMYEVMTPNHLLFGRKLYQENPNWEMHEVMTPNYLLFGRKLYQENPNWESNSDIIEPDLPKRTEYVESLQKGFKPKNQLFPAKNHLVLIYEEKQPRQKWMLGNIVDLIPSQYGQIRGARVLLGKSRNTVDRPVNRLYPLETNSKFVLKDSE